MTKETILLYRDDIRKEIITEFYEKLLGREADESGLSAYADSPLPLEVVYYELKSSKEASLYRAKKERICKTVKLPITLAVFAKDCEDALPMCITSVRDYVEDVLVVDTGSTDGTVEVAKDLGARVYKVGFSDFGSIRTLTAHLARTPWVLGLDADEKILKEDIPLLWDLVEQEDVDAWALPRMRWLDLEMTVQLEPEVYPDWQVRLIRSKTSIQYVRRIHEMLVGDDVRKYAAKGPTIHHFQDSFKNGKKLKNRNEMYKQLYEKDLADGVSHDGPVIADIDKEEK